MDREVRIWGYLQPGLSRRQFIRMNPQPSLPSALSPFYDVVV